MTARARRTASGFRRVSVTPVTLGSRSSPDSRHRDGRRIHVGAALLPALLLWLLAATELHRRAGDGPPSAPERHGTGLGGAVVSLIVTRRTDALALGAGTGLGAAARSAPRRRCGASSAGSSGSASVTTS